MREERRYCDQCQITFPTHIDWWTHQCRGSKDTFELRCLKQNKSFHAGYDCPECKQEKSEEEERKRKIIFGTNYGSKPDLDKIHGERWGTCPYCGHHVAEDEKFERHFQYCRSYPRPKQGEEKTTRPSVTHYNSTSIEPIDVINDWSKVWGEDSYLCGNVIKYLRRYKAKGGVEDLKKAQDYLTWLIEKHDADI